MWFYRHDKSRMSNAPIFNRHGGEFPPKCCSFFARRGTRGVNEKIYPDVSATNLLAPASDDIPTSSDHSCSCSCERRHDTAAACAPTNSYYSAHWHRVAAATAATEYTYILWGRRASRATCDFSFYSPLLTQMNFVKS